MWDLGCIFTLVALQLEQMCPSYSLRSPRSHPHFTYPFSRPDQSPVRHSRRHPARLHSMSQRPRLSPPHKLLSHRSTTDRITIPRIQALLISPILIIPARGHISIQTTRIMRSHILRLNRHIPPPPPRNPRLRTLRYSHPQPQLMGTDIRILPHLRATHIARRLDPTV